MPRIIDDKIFYEVQRRMESIRKTPAKAKAKNEYLLTTKLFCGHCNEMMTGISGTSQTGKLYQYYICNGVKAKKCNKTKVAKDLIENKVVQETRDFLTTKNIERIAKNIVKLCEKDKAGTRLTQLQKELKDNERKRNNLINAVAECEVDSIRKSLYEEMSKLELAKTNIKKEINSEEASCINTNEEDVIHILKKMRQGSIDDVKYKRMLINTIIDRIYLYDDGRMTLVYTLQNKKVDVDINTIQQAESSFLVRHGQPNIPIIYIGIFFMCFL